MISRSSPIACAAKRAIRRSRAPASRSCFALTNSREPSTACSTFAHTPSTLSFALAPGVALSDAVDAVTQAQNDIGASIDGVTSKSPYTGVVNQVDGVVQGSMDAMEEVKVLTTGVSAEYGHTAGGSMKMVYKSGTNSLHGSFDDRYLPGNWVHRAYLTQFVTPPNAPWFYETFDLVGSGPVVIPKLYNGKNRTFFFVDYEGFRRNQQQTLNATIPRL